MDYLHVVTGIIGCLVGGALVFVIFYRRILSDTVLFNSHQRSSKGAVKKLWYEFYARLSSDVDLSEYENSLELVEIERKRIGLDVHDELAAHISSLYIDIQVVLFESQNLSPQGEKILLEMRGKVQHTVEAIRKIIYGLVPTSLEMSTLDEALAELCRKKEKSSKGTTILFRTSGPRIDLKPECELYIFRIIQELISNALKHSGAWDIFVTMLWTKSKLQITVRDNGKGLPATHNEKAGRHGIKGIFVRSQVIGATAKFNSSSGGTEFVILIPLQENIITKNL
ncbi:MAG TPA: ATP-binding protein [Cyclobacteriaceae bacterium]